MIREAQVKSNRDFAWLFMVVGGDLLCGAAVMGIHTRMFVAHAQSAPGTVVRVEEAEGSDEDTFYQPIVRFTTASGQEAALGQRRRMTESASIFSMRARFAGYKVA